jgi:hypothetical protein
LGSGEHGRHEVGHYTNPEGPGEIFRGEVLFLIRHRRRQKRQPTVRASRKSASHECDDHAVVPMW